MIFETHARSSIDHTAAQFLPRVIGLESTRTWIYQCERGRENCALREDKTGTLWAAEDTGLRYLGFSPNFTAVESSPFTSQGAADVCERQWVVLMNCSGALMTSAACAMKVGRLRRRRRDGRWLGECPEWPLKRSPCRSSGRARRSCIIALGRRPRELPALRRRRARKILHCAREL